MQGTNVIRVRTKDDLLEMWSDIRKQRSCTLWCDGLVEFGSKYSKSNIKRKHASDDESEEELPRSRKKKKKAANEDRVQEVVDNLRSKQGSKFTTLQLRIWAELISSGLYTSTDEPPSNNSMFQRAGGESSGKKIPNQGESVAQAFAEAASAITSALTGTTKSAPPTASTSTSSPAKLIDSRSKLYKQLTELQSLKSAGILTETEYATEKETIMDLLKQLKGR